MVTLGDTHQHRLRPAVVVVHLREQQHDVGSPKRCRRPLSRFCISAHKLKCCAEPARPTSSSLRLAAVAQAPVHLCNGDCPPLPRVARDITDSARCRSNVGLGGAITNEIDWPGQILKGHEAARNGPPSASTTPRKREKSEHLPNRFRPGTAERSMARPLALLAAVQFIEWPGHQNAAPLPRRDSAPL
jgi:hypothetical protein